MPSIDPNMVEGLPITIGPSNNRYEQTIMPLEIRNSYLNHRHIWNEFADEIAHPLHDIMPTEEGKRGPCLIMGSGASFDDVAPYLRDWPGAIICSSSHASSCVYWKHPPEYIIGLDVRTGIDKLPVPDWGETNSRMICHPGMAPEFISFWKWQKHYFRMRFPQSYFYRVVIPIAYPMIVDELMLFACSISAEVSIAGALGYSPLVLVGADFGCPGKYYRFHAMLWDKEKGWYREKHEQTRDTLNQKMRSDNGIMTTALDIFYKRSLLNVWRIDQTPILQTSLRSTLTEFPMVPIQEVVRRARKGIPYDDLYDNPKEQLDRVDIYLSRHNCYSLEVQTPKGGSIHFFEVPAGHEVEIMRKRATEIRDALQKRNPETTVDVEGTVARIEWIIAERNRRFPNDAQRRKRVIYPKLDPPSGVFVPGNTDAPFISDERSPVAKGATG